MINTFNDLKEYLNADSKNLQPQSKSQWRLFKSRIFSDPINDQYYIWKYVYYLRHVEYILNRNSRKKNILNICLKAYYLYKLRKISYITGFQIPPFTCGKGLTIYHWGSIIINGDVRIGENCVLYPGVLIGWKGPDERGCAHIGNNVFIGSGTKIIGPVNIGNNVIIGQNCVVVKDIPDNSVIVTNNIRYL